MSVVVFEIELIKQIEMNIDYILGLIRKDHQLNSEDKEWPTGRAIDSSFNLRNKKELIEQFVAKLTLSSNIEGDGKEFIN